MKGKTSEEKDAIVKRLATAFHQILKEQSPKSIRALASDAGMEYAHLQRIFKGEVNISFTVLMTVLESLQISSRDFFKVYDQLKDIEVEDFKKTLSVHHRK